MNECGIQNEKYLFCGLTMMLSKSATYILLRNFLSFMFDDLDIVNLVPRRIDMHCIMLNIKNMKINDVLKINNMFHLNLLYFYMGL
jgi:hypothetical protein